MTRFIFYLLLTMWKQEKINASREAQKAKREKQYRKKDRKYILGKLSLYLPNLFAENYNRTKHPFWKEMYEEVSTFDWARMNQEMTTDDLVLLYSCYDSDWIVYEDKRDYDLDEEDIKEFKEIPCKEAWLVDMALCMKYSDTIIPF
jgi:hypothetical protein